MYLKIKIERKRIMTNDQAKGYVLLACKELEISKEQAQQILNIMHNNFDRYTEQEAEDLGFKWLYNENNLV